MNVHIHRSPGIALFYIKGVSHTQLDREKLLSTGPLQTNRVTYVFYPTYSM